MTTVAEVLDDTLAQLLGSTEAIVNRLNGAVTSSAQAMTFEFEIKGIREGSVIAIEEEDILVLGVNTTSQEVTACVRGYRGTTAAAHSDDVLVYVSPRFSRGQVLRELRKEIASWPRYIYRVATTTLTISSTDTRGYDLLGVGSDFYFILNVRAEPLSTRFDMPTTWSKIGFSWAANQLTSVFPSGFALFLSSPLEVVTSRRLLVEYARGFDLSPFTAATSLEADVGLAASMVDIPPLGAMWRLMLGRETQRTEFQPQGQSRRAEEVPVGSVSEQARQLKASRDQRLREEAMNLVSQYGYGGF